MDLTDRTFRDDPLTQDYLYYVQNQLQERVPISEIEPPERFFLRRQGKDYRDQNELDDLRASGNDPKYKAISKIYEVLLGFPRPGIGEKKGK